MLQPAARLRRWRPNPSVFSSLSHAHGGQLQHQLHPWAAQAGGHVRQQGGAGNGQPQSFPFSWRTEVTLKFWCTSLELSYYRDTAVGYNSVEKLLPPYPCPPAPPHRKSNGVAGGVFENPSALHSRLDNPHSYSYSYSNISDMQTGHTGHDRQDNTHLAHAHCCSSAAGKYDIFIHLFHLY